MTHAGQLSASLLMALVLWIPSFSATIRGDLELPTAAFRYLAAFALARIAFGLLSRLVIAYAATPTAPEPAVDLGDGQEVPARRSSDPLTERGG